MSYPHQNLALVWPYFRPWRFALIAFLLFIGLCWVLQSGVEFDGELRWSTLTTGGWFLLGLPFTIGMALAYAAFIAMLARRIHKGLAWLMLTLTLALFKISFDAQLPAARVTAIVGERAARLVSIERLRAYDTFNEGVMTWGVIVGPEQAFDFIIKDRSLRLEEDTSLNAFRYFDSDEDASIPELGPIYCNERTKLYRHPTTGKVYFKHQSGKFHPGTDDA